jgi:hypothetical protein
MAMDLTPEQQGIKTKITMSAILWGIIAGLVVALLAFWLLQNAADWLRWVLTVILGAGGGYLTFRLTYNSGVAKAVCKNCGTAFGIREVDRVERITGTEQRRKVQAGRPPSKTDRGTNKITTWTEEKVEVTAIDECFNCHNRTERKWTMTRDKDKTESETPA